MTGTGDDRSTMGGVNKTQKRGEGSTGSERKTKRRLTYLAINTTSIREKSPARGDW